MVVMAPNSLPESSPGQSASANSASSNSASSNSASSGSSDKARSTPPRWRSLFGLTLLRISALVALANLLLVLFDLSYVPWRNFWLQGRVRLPVIGQAIQLPLPQAVQAGDAGYTQSHSLITQAYDRVKGIEPHRDTVDYLRGVQALRQQLQARDLLAGQSAAQVIGQGVGQTLTTPELEAAIANLQRQSLSLIEDNPFQAAGKGGTLERIKRLMREHQGGSSKWALTSFWNPANLAPDRWQGQLAFFDRQIQPLMATNYYRGLGEDSEPIDRFDRLDAGFQVFFALELLVAIVWIKRRHPSLGWREALLWRWYDLLLFVPIWRWLRVLPVAVRLQRAQWVDVEALQSQFSRGFVGLFAAQLIEVIALQTINQVQTTIKRGNLTRWISQSLGNRRTYIDLNNVNEVEELARQVGTLIVYQLLPRLQPELVTIVQDSLEAALRQSPVYQLFERIPGIGTAPIELNRQILSGVSQGLTGLSQRTYDGISAPNPQAAAAIDRIAKQLSTALIDALQDQNRLNEIQSLLADLIEEFKVNYVQSLSDANFEAVLEEAQQIRQL
jgi:hypothetical protein